MLRGDQGLKHAGKVLSDPALSHPPGYSSHTEGLEAESQLETPEAELEFQPRLTPALWATAGRSHTHL